LQKQFHDGGHSNIQADGVAQRCVFGGSKDAGGKDRIFGVGQNGSGIGGGQAVLMQKLEESFEGIDFAADGFGSVIVAGKEGQVISEVLGGESGDLGDTLPDKMLFELGQIAAVGGNGSRRALLGFEVIDKLLQGHVEADWGG